MKKIKNSLLYFVLFVLIFSTFSYANSQTLPINSQTNSSISSTKESIIPEPEIFANSAILIEPQTGLIIYEKNSDEKMYPASTTKILTAILTIEKCKLDEIVTVQSSSLSGIPNGYVVGNIYAGEELSVEDLLYALMLKSANDVAVVLADYVSGSVEEFSNLMNQKAKEIGCTNTHFVNPNGIHDENHYTTAKDLALIADYCMKNETFRKIVSTKEYTLPRTNKYVHENRFFTNTNYLILDSSPYFYEYAIGIKTGYTAEAKGCLISSAKNNEVEFIGIVLDSDSQKYGKNTRFVDSKKLLEYGINNYTFTEFVKKDTKIKNIEIENATKETKSLNLIIKDSLTCLNRKDLDFNSIEPQIELYPNLLAPIEKGSKLGKITYTIEGIEYSSDLLSETEVIKKFNYALLAIILGGILLVIGFIIFIVSKLKKKKNHNKRARSRK